MRRPRSLVDDAPPWSVNDATRAPMWGAHAPALCDLRWGAKGFADSDDVDDVIDEMGNDDAG